MAYCGIGSVPKGKRRGTYSQCAKLNQIRYYGVHKPTIVEELKYQLYQIEVVRDDIILEQLKLAKIIKNGESKKAKKKKISKSELNKIINAKTKLKIVNKNLNDELKRHVSLSNRIIILQMEEIEILHEMAQQEPSNEEAIEEIAQEIAQEIAEEISPINRSIHDLNLFDRDIPLDLTDRSIPLDYSVFDIPLTNLDSSRSIPLDYSVFDQ